MSTVTRRRILVSDRGLDRLASYRVAALAGAAVLTGAYLAPLHRAVDVVGSRGELVAFAVLVVAAPALAVVLGRRLRLRLAVALGGAMLLLGLGAYLLGVPGASFQLERHLVDTVALLTGLSVLRMTEAARWALGFTPGPLFVSTYLFVRRRYALGVLVAGGALAFFISTGDVEVVRGLAGTLGAIVALGFGRLDREGGAPAARDSVVVLLVAVLVVTTSVSLVPGGEARPLLPDGQGQTVESSLTTGGDAVTVLGSIELSPARRFTVTAERLARWRVGAFDRYTGDGWVRSGQAQAYQGPLADPESDDETPLRQTYEVESATSVMPAAWKVQRVEDVGSGTLVTSMAALEPRQTLETGDTYTVVSRTPDHDRTELRRAGTDYPDEIVERYTQLPESTPDRLGTFTGRLTADASNPYDAARVVERWLQANKAYSLTVDRPQGDVAASFVFEMDQGYCVYFATAMVTMLRSQGIPARFVTGYTAGEQVDDDRWVVRGLDSHAWVEVYFPDHGWVAFDPTPAGPRESVEQDRLTRAQAVGAGEGGDADQAATPSPAPTPTPDPTAGGSAGNGTAVTETIPPGLLPGGGAGGSNPSTDGGPSLPDERTVLYGLILFAGAATAAHRSGITTRGRRLLWLRRSPDGPPDRRVEGTFERLEYLLGRLYRPRRRGETPRAYLESLRSGRLRTVTRATPGTVNDPRLDQLFELYEQAHYAGRVTPADADRAWRLLTELREHWSAWS